MNIILKSLITTITGAAATAAGGAIITALDNPTGGLATFLGQNPALALVYASAVGYITTFVHNYLSKVSPPSTVVTTADMHAVAVTPK